VTIRVRVVNTSTLGTATWARVQLAWRSATTSRTAAAK